MTSYIPTCNKCTQLIPNYLADSSNAALCGIRDLEIHDRNRDRSDCPYAEYPYTPTPEEAEAWRREVEEHQSRPTNVPF